MSKVVKENVKAKVVTVTKRGREGQYKAKAIQVDGKDWMIGKRDDDKVKVGNEYLFNLVKNEYNDKLYYFANLVKDGEDGGEEDSTSGEDENFKKRVFGWIRTLSFEEKKKLFNYLFDILVKEGK